MVAPPSSKIVFFATREHSYTISELVVALSTRARLPIECVAYGDLQQDSLPSAGVYVFSDIERLDAAERERAAAIRDELQNRSPSVCLLNHPLQSLDRPALLRALHECGKNPFNAYSVDEALQGSPRYPVFVRQANEHHGPFSRPLGTRNVLLAALAQARDKGLDERHLLVIEYVDVRDPQGWFHKYSAFRIGGQIIARHLFFSRGWVVKEADSREPVHLAREREYQETNPHRAALTELFDLAHIDYGRIDYSLHQGRMHVWEINTNPMVLRPQHFADTTRVQGHERFAQRFVGAMQALTSGSAGHGR
jgi:hypothetical protein